MGIATSESESKAITLNRYPRNFSNGKAVDYVETEKSRIVIHELEKNWWILAVSLSLRDLIYLAILIGLCHCRVLTSHGFHLLPLV